MRETSSEPLILRDYAQARVDHVNTLTEKARAEGHLRIDTSGKTEKIVYIAVSRSERWADPEEKVRAEFYAELIYKYGYAPERIGVEVTVAKLLV